MDGSRGPPRGCRADLPRRNYRHDGFKGWFDLATTPLWSNFVDLHGTTLLVCLFSITGNLTFPVAAAWAVLSAVVRWNVIFNDFACLNVGCVDDNVVAILLTAPGDAGAPGLALGAAPYQLGTPGHCHPCPLDVGAFADNWSTNLYTPTHTRLAPIFVGAALAAALKNARPSPPIPPLRFAVLGLALLWAAESHALAPKLLTARVGAMLGSPQAVDALGSLAISTAWAVIVFAAVVPFDHWLRCDPIRRVLGASIWRFPASLTFGVCRRVEIARPGARAGNPRRMLWIASADESRPRRGVPRGSSVGARDVDVPWTGRGPAAGCLVDRPRRRVAAAAARSRGGRGGQLGRETAASTRFAGLLPPLARAHARAQVYQAPAVL